MYFVFSAYDCNMLLACVLLKYHAGLAINCRETQVWVQAKMEGGNSIGYFQFITLRRVFSS
jgi:hypothetical protein